MEQAVVPASASHLLRYLRSATQLSSLHWLKADWWLRGMAERPLAVASGFVGGNGKKEEPYYASEQTGNSDRANRRKRKLRTERKEPALRPISDAPNDNNIKITVMAMDVGEAKKKANCCPCSFTCLGLGVPLFRSSWIPGDLSLRCSPCWFVGLME